MITSGVGAVIVGGLVAFMLGAGFATSSSDFLRLLLIPPVRRPGTVLVYRGKPTSRLLRWFYAGFAVLMAVIAALLPATFFTAPGDLEPPVPVFFAADYVFDLLWLIVMARRYAMPPF